MHPRPLVPRTSALAPAPRSANQYQEQGLHLLVSGSTTLRLVYFGFPGEWRAPEGLTGSARVVMLHLLRCIRATCLTSLLRADCVFVKTACGIRTRASRMAPSCSSAETKAAKLLTNERVGARSARPSAELGLGSAERVSPMDSGIRPFWIPDAPSCQRSCSASAATRSAEGWSHRESHPRFDRARVA